MRMLYMYNIDIKNPIFFIIKEVGLKYISVNAWSIFMIID